MLFEPARLGDRRGGRKDQRADRFDPRKQVSGRQAEMKAHDRRPRLLKDCAHGLAKRGADRRDGNGGWIDASLGVIGREPIAPARLDLGIGLRLGMAKEVHVERGVRRLSDGGDLLA